MSRIFTRRKMSTFSVGHLCWRGDYACVIENNIFVVFCGDPNRQWRSRCRSSLTEPLNFGLSSFSSFSSFLFFFFAARFCFIFILHLCQRRQWLQHHHRMPYVSFKIQSFVWWTHVPFSVLSFPFVLIHSTATLVRSLFHSNSHIYKEEAFLSNVHKFSTFRYFFACLVHETLRTVFLCSKRNEENIRARLIIIIVVVVCAFFTFLSSTRICQSCRFICVFFYTFISFGLF